MTEKEDAFVSLAKLMCPEKSEDELRLIFVLFRHYHLQWDESDTLENFICDKTREYLND